MIRVLIVDDEGPARAKLRSWLGEHAGVQVIGEATDGIEAAACIAAQRPDLVLLDIQMPGVNGLEVAAQLDDEDAPLIVFVTAYDEFAVKAFELDAVDYLLKPYDKERLAITVARAAERLAGSHARSCEAVASARRLLHVRAPLTRLVVPSGSSLQLLDVGVIEWLEADDNYVHVHACQRKFTLRRTLRDLLELLDALVFVRVHKSSAVNLAAIESLEPLFKGDYELLLRTGQAVRMSRRYAPKVLALLGK